MHFLPCLCNSWSAVHSVPHNIITTLTKGIVGQGVHHQSSLQGSRHPNHDKWPVRFSSVWRERSKVVEMLAPSTLIAVVSRSCHSANCGTFWIPRKNSSLCPWSEDFTAVLHCASKRIPDTFYPLGITLVRIVIFIIFGTYIKKRLGNQRIVYFPTSSK